MKQRKEERWNLLIRRGIKEMKKEKNVVELMR